MIEKKRMAVHVSPELNKRLAMYAAEREMSKMAVADIAISNFLDKKDAVKARAAKRASK